jgi:1,4-dihydroxy-2-naphthoyl-CoA hydrolase
MATTGPEGRTELETLLATMPFSVACGIRLEWASAGRVSGRMDWAPERCTAAGVLHGGALMTLADSLGAICAFLNLPPGATTSTIESKTNFLRAVRSGHVTAVARPLHVGHTTIVVQTDLRDAGDRPVAIVIQTQAVQNSRGVSDSMPRSSS